jgi:hypothetical protein
MVMGNATYSKDDVMTDQAPVVSPAPPVTDQRLYCPSCEYNLTGLTRPECPECGRVVDWEAARRIRRQELGEVATAWERWPWYAKPPAFVITALHCAFLPWSFARRLAFRPRLAWPLIFGVICLVWIALWGPERWYVAAGVLAQILLQVVVFSALFPLPRRRFPVRYWLAVSCYTSYPVLIEALAGGPAFLLIELPPTTWPPDAESSVWPFSLVSGWTDTSPVATFLFYLWCFNLMVIAWRNLPTRRRWRAALLPFVLLVLTVVASYVGAWIGETLD